MPSYHRQGVLLALCLPLLAGAFMRPSSMAPQRVRSGPVAQRRRAAAPSMVAAPGVEVESVSRMIGSLGS